MFTDEAYMKETPLEELFDELKKEGIELSEERILNDYKECRNLEDLCERYINSKENKEAWERLQCSGRLNEDIMYTITERIVLSHMKPEDTCDPYFIDKLAGEAEQVIASKKPVSSTQAEKLLKALIHYSEQTGEHYLKQIDPDKDYTALVAQVVNAVDQRSEQFRDTLAEFLKDYYDADTSAMFSDLPVTDETETAKVMFEAMQGLMKMKDNMDKQNNACSEDILKELNMHGILLSEEKIIKDYAEVRDSGKLADQYRKEFRKQLDKYNDSDDTEYDSDVIYPLVRKIAGEHYDMIESGDIEYLNDLADHLETEFDQKECEKLIQGLINYGKRTGTRLLEDAGDFYIWNEVLIEYVKKCHERNMNFRTLIIKLYETFDDASPKIFPSAYRDWQAKQKSSK